jgi:GNAT superfamily N-acetyltransferase
MTADAAPLLRRAKPEDAEAITRLTLRAKRHWGYSEAFMAVMTPDLTLTSADLSAAADQVEVLETDGELLGFFRLRCRTELACLEDLFVDPGCMGQGYGRRLFLRAADIAREWGRGVMEFESDPYAESFYLRLGATREGMSPSSLLPGRSIPLMRYAL